MKRIMNTWGKLNRRMSAVSVLSAAMAIALPAETFTTLHSFDGTDGTGPGPVVQATNGDLYGNTLGGGANGAGTVFKITTTGVLTTLYSFCSQNGCADGEYPRAWLVQATNGYLFGTAQSGGTDGYGTVFRVTPSGALTALYSFCSQSGCADGTTPDSGLVQATNGDLYGTTSDGGDAFGGFGTVFKITPSGTLTTVHIFAGNFTGIEPVAGLVQAANGDLYGTTIFGGANGAGTVFKMTPGGALTTLYSFCGEDDCGDGQNPQVNLVQATNGDLYGTTSLGGANAMGTVFKMTPSGALTTLYSFCSQSGCPDGSGFAPLVQATNGDLYGTTVAGGESGYGTIFKITPGGTLTTLHSFDGTDGEYPGGLIQDTNGLLYGTTTAGGANNYGTVFSLSVGLGPFVKTQTASGEVGAPINILGSDLTGATSVTFNGIAAAFTVVSRYLITTTVPAGASTGEVEVVTPSRTLSSNVPFRVP